MNISIRSIVRQSAKFNVVSIISLIIQIPTQLIIGRFLSPQEYGIIGFVALWSLYGGLLNPGMLSAASREVPYLLGKNEKEKAKSIQDISISSDIIWTVLPFLVILVASFCYRSNEVMSIALLITGINFLIVRFAGYWSTFNFTRQNFSIVAIGNLISTIARPILIIITIYWLKIYAVLLAPVFGCLLMFFYYLKKGSINYRFRLNWPEIKKLVKVGAVFSLSGLVFYGHRIIGSTIIAAYLPLYQLGLYTFAMGLIIFAVNFLADFGRVLEPMLWKKSGVDGNTIESFLIVKRIAIYIALFTAIGAPFLQIVYGYIVPLVTPKYINSIVIFNILSLYIYLAAIVMLPAVVLNSSIVNKQKKLTLLYAIGFGLGALLDLFFIRLGFGITTIAVITVLTQGLITFSALFLARSYITKKNNEFAELLGMTLPPFIISILFTIFNSYNFLKIKFFPQSLISLLLQIIIWTLIVTLFYRQYFPRRQIIEMWDKCLAYLSRNKQSNLIN